jgi:hypothetical protein
VGLTLAARVAGPGEAVAGVARWHAARPAGAGAWRVTVQCARDLPRDLVPPVFLERPVRKLLEGLRHERYRFREDHLPAGGEYGVDLWRADEVVQDSFALRVPPDAADGTYRVVVRLQRQPHYPNDRLGDWFLDRDPRDVAAGTLEVRRGRSGRTS